MKIILAATPAAGHFDPILGIARLLVQHGHDVLVYTGSVFRERVRRIGASFQPLPRNVDYDLRDPGKCFPERAGLTGVDLLQFDFANIVTGPIPAQYGGLRELLLAFPAEIVIAEQLFLGALPLVLANMSNRPALIGCGVSFLSLDRADGMPHGLGLPFIEDRNLRLDLQKKFLPSAMTSLAPLQSMYEEALRASGVTPQGMPISAMATYADQFWQAGVPEMEFPVVTMPDHVHFVGNWPSAPAQVASPAWAAELDRRRKVVLVTQGTVTNGNFEQLLLPTIRALATRDDVLVLGTTGGQPIPAGIGALPANVRLEEYLPFDELMPRVDALVTNGGFGTIVRALAHSVPIVVAGNTEDKPDIAARIERANAGVNLCTGTPSEESLAKAVDHVLSDHAIRKSVSHIAQSFRRHRAEAIILSTITAIASGGRVQRAVA